MFKNFFDSFRRRANGNELNSVGFCPFRSCSTRRTWWKSFGWMEMFCRNRLNRGCNRYLFSHSVVPMENSHVHSCLEWRDPQSMNEKRWRLMHFRFREHGNGDGGYARTRPKTSGSTREMQWLVICYAFNCQTAVWSNQSKGWRPHMVFDIDLKRAKKHGNILAVDD